MAHIMISYSRRDRDFVRGLHARLAAEGRDVWVDWEDIPISTEWMRDIEGAIEAADAVVFVISPDSIASAVCKHECDHAASFHKRIIPVVARDVEPKQVPSVLAKLHWLFFRSEDDFDAAYRQLVAAVELDLSWVRAHSRLLVRAREWETHEKEAGYLLSGADLEESEQSLTEGAERKPRATALQMAYVSASRQRETQRLRNQLRGFYLVSLIYGVLQAGVSYVVAFDAISEEGLVALAPLWVLGIVFGGFGLTIGRNSLLRSVVATGVGGVLLYGFFVAIFPQL